MGTLDRATQPINEDKYERTEPPKPHFGLAPHPVQADSQPGRDAFQRCPMPPITVNPDSLRQFFQGNVVPQTRVLTPPQVVPGGKNNTIINKTTVLGSSGSTVVDTTSTTETPQPVSYTTAVLSPGAAEQASVEIAPLFSALQVSVSGSARVQMYSTGDAQAADMGRDTVTPPASGSMHEVILDVVLDVQLNWVMSPVAVGANADDPQSSTIYLTITNLGPSADSIIATILYEVS